MPESNALAAFTDEDIKSVCVGELEWVHKRIHPQERPRAILLAGQPGAGKTELSTMIAKQLNNDAVLINGDDYRRYHPHYQELYKAFGSDSVQMTSAFSSAVVNELIERLSDEQINIIVEGTGRTVEVPRTTAEKLKGKGYTVEMAVIAARPETSLISTLLRFYQMNESGTIPRATAVEAHDHVVEVLPGNLDVLAGCLCIEHISIWDRELRQLYGETESRLPPSAILRQYWNRPWTAEEWVSARADVELLFQKEQEMNLGQMRAITELDDRLSAVKPMEHNKSKNESCL